MDDGRRPNRSGSRAAAGKKRKLELIDPEGERTLYASFVAAANSLSQLYAQSQQQQRKGAALASRQTLERVAQVIMRDYAQTEVVPKSALLHLLSVEYEGILEGNEGLLHQDQPVAVQATGQPTEDAVLSEGQRSLLSPTGRRNVHHGASAMDADVSQTLGDSHHQQGFDYSFS